MKLSKFALMLILVLFFSPSVIAVSISDMSLEFNERYINDGNFLSSFKCNGDDYTGAKINITKGDWWYSPSGFTETPLGGNETQIAYNINPGSLDGTGVYHFTGVCLGNNTDSTSSNFDIYSYEIEIISPSSTVDVVQGDYVNTIFTFKKIIGTSEQNVDNAKFNVILSRSGQEFLLSNSKTPDQVSGNLEISSFVSYIPNNDFYGLNDLIVEYSSKPNIKDTASNKINIRNAFEISFEDPYPLQMSEGGSIDVPVLITSPIIDTSNLYELSFNVKIGGSQETISSSDMPPCSKNGDGVYRCVLPVSVPEKSAGNYDLKIEGNFQSYYDEISKDLYFTIPFMGTLTYASGQIVDAEIELHNLDTGKWYRTDVNSGTGKYSLEILPGNYRLKITSPQIERLELDGLYIGEEDEMITSNSPMSLDSFIGGGTIAGINSVKLVVFQFALEFDESQIWLKYDDIDVTGSENDLELYSCHDWNYGKRECNGDWDTVPFSINKVTNIINFNVTEFSAFILGNKKKTSLEVTMDKDKYYARDQVTFTGNVIDNKDASSIENAKVSYRIKDTPLSGFTYTDERGHFVASDLIAPSDEGAYTMEITVEKNPFKPITATHIIKVEKKKEFSVVVPEEVRVDLDKSVQEKINIINTGQKDFGSISVSARGISTDWYSIVPMTINNLSVGSEKSVSINFKVPSEYCEEECKIYHFVDVIAKSDDGYETIKSFTFRINENVTTVSSDNFSLPSIPTGNIVGSISNPYVAVIVFIVLVFIVLFFLKRKKSSGIKYNNNSFVSRKKFKGGNLSPPTFFKKGGYENPSNNAPYRSKYKRAKTPRESVVPVLYRVKNSSKDWK